MGGGHRANCYCCWPLKVGACQFEHDGDGDEKTHWLLLLLCGGGGGGGGGQLQQQDCVSGGKKEDPRNAKRADEERCWCVIVRLRGSGNGHSKRAGTSLELMRVRSYQLYPQAEPNPKLGQTVSVQMQKHWPFCDACARV